MSMPIKISRRVFAKELAGTTVAAMLPAKLNAAQGHNIFDALGQYEFIGQDGKPVNANALRIKLKDDYLTVSFGFKDCDRYCPMVDACISKLGQISKQKLTSIVLSVQPEIDGVNPASREAFMRKLKEEYRIKQNVVILYPAHNGVASKDAARHMPELATKLGAIVDMNSPVRHSAEIMLYAPGGNFITKKNGMTSPSEFDTAWSHYLNPQRSK